MVGLRSPRRLSLGRHEQWVRIGMRIVLVILAAGVLVDGGLRLGHATAARPNSTTAQVSDQAAQAFASRCLVAYLNFDETKRDDHATQLQPCLAGSADPQLGWDGKGKQGVFGGPYVVAAERRDGVLWVTETALVNGNRWLYLAVPVVGRDGSYAIPSAPVLVPAPQQPNWSLPATSRSVDPDLTSQRHDDMEAFFKAYALSDLGLAYFQAPGVSFQGLRGSVTYDGMPDFIVYTGGSDRTAFVTVRWHDTAAGATYPQGYRLHLKQVNGRWLVSDLVPAVPGGIS